MKPRLPAFPPVRRALAHGMLVYAVWLGLMMSVAPVTAATAMEALYRRCAAAGVEVLIDGRHSGSGWFVTSTGTVVTAAHLFMRREGRIEVMSPQLGRLPCVLVARDLGHDVAVLQADPPLRQAPVLALAARRPATGDEIYQFGAPIFRQGLLQTGRVARPETGFEYYGVRLGYVEVMHLSAMMQGGTSGGPWVDRKGRVVGVQSGSMSLENRPIGMAYLSPVEAVHALLKTRRDAATAEAGLGLDQAWELDVNYLKQLPADSTGLVVSVLRTNGPAAKAGVQRRDYIMAVDDRPLRRVADLLRYVRARRPGDTITLQCWRPATKETNTFQLTLDCAEEVVWREK